MFNVEHDNRKLTSNYTISLIIHNEVFDVSLQVDISSLLLSHFFQQFFSFFFYLYNVFIRLIMLQGDEMSGEPKGKMKKLFFFLLYLLSQN